MGRGRIGGLPLARSFLGVCLIGCLVILSQGAQADCTPSANGLLGWWPGDGNANDIVFSNNGTLVGNATAVGAGQVGLAFTFDGVNSAVQIPDAPSLRPTNLTIECWVRFNSLDSTGSGPPAGVQYIVFKQNTRTSNFEGFDLGKTRSGGSDVFKFIVTSAAGQAVSLLSTTVVSAGNWYHLAAVRGSNFVQLYVNGALERQTNVAFAQDYGNLPLCFGTSGQPTWDRRLNGTLDEVSLYNRALSSNEIAAIYSAGSAGKCKAPIISVQPQSQTVTEGSNAFFSVTATGFGTLGYQWQSNGLAILGATTSSLSFSNAQGFMEANYSVVVLSSFGSVTSAVASLAVNPVNCLPASPGLIGWWNADGQTFDSAGTNHGTLTNGTAFAVGKVGTAYSFDGVDDFVASPAVFSNVFDSYTMEFWAWPAAGRASTAETLSGTQGMSNQRYAIYPRNADNGYSEAGVSVGTNGVSVFEHGPFYIPSLLVYDAPIIGWTHIAVTYSNRQPRLYLNGQLVRTGLTSTRSTIPSSWFGEGPYGLDYGHYSGLLDEVSIYNRTLLSAEIQAIYESRGRGKCPLPVNFLQSLQSRTNTEGGKAVFSSIAVGTPTINYQWFFNGTPMTNSLRVTGATSGVLRIDDLQTNDAGSYVLIATNGLAAVTNAATLAVNLAACAPPPPGLIGWWNADSTVLDSANTNHGILVNGTTFAPGAVGQALSFDGINDYVTIPTIFSNMVDSYTMEFWALPTAGRASTTESTTGTQGNNNQRYALFPQNANNGFPEAGVSVGTNGISVFEHLPFIISSPLVYDAPIIGWTHIAVVYSNRQPRLYVDGELVRLGLTSTRSTSPAAHFSDDGITGYGRYSGLLDEVSYYNRSLASNEIRLLYESKRFGKCPLPPTYYFSFQDKTMGVGGTISLSPLVLGAPPLTYQWFFNGEPLSDSAHINGSHSNVLNIVNVQTNDTGIFSLLTTNAVGVATAAVAKLTVVLPPTFAIQPTNSVWIAGSNYSLASLAMGAGPLSYQWYRNGAMLTDNARFTGTASNVLTVTAIQTADAGNYTVVATNFGGAVTSDVGVITVVVPPTITTQPRGWSIPIGLPVTLNAAASGTAPLSYQWLLNESPVPIATNTTLVITNLTLANFGSYRFVASNGGGSATSTVALLTVGNVAVWGTSFAVSGATPPMWLPPGISNIVAVAANAEYSLGLRENGTIIGWAQSSNPATNVPPGLGGVVAIAAGISHAVALRSNGTVVAWGSGTQTNVPPGLSNIVAVAAGNLHSTALRSDGTVVAWGFNNFSQTNVPAGLIGVRSIDVGLNQTLAFRENGNVVVWGQGGDQPTFPPTPRLTDVVTGSAGQRHDIVLKSDGSLVSWGNHIVTNIPPGLSNIVAVEAIGGSRIGGITLALRSNGLLVAWGDNSTGITNVPVGLSNVVAMAGGYYHALALVTDGRPLVVRQPVGGTFYTARRLALKTEVAGKEPMSFQWYKNGDVVLGADSESLILSFAQLSDAGNYYLIASNALGVAQSVTVPVTVVDGPPQFLSQPVSRFAYYGSPFSVGASIVGSGPMELTWLQNGVAAYTGTNELSFESAEPQHNGTYQLLASNPFGAVTSSIAQIKFTRAAVWGVGPSLTNAPVDLGTIKDIVAAYYHLLAIRADGTVVAWGTTLNGATNVPAGLSNVVAVTGGKFFSVALRSNGTAIAWGMNNFGQTSVPASATNLIAIAAGGDHVLALRANGTVVAWGYGGNGQTNIPAGLSNVVAISAGQWHSAALTADGTAVTWGLSAVNPSNATNLIAIAAGFSYTVGLRPDGTVIGWMNGNQTVPTNLANVVSIASGGASPQNFGTSFALKTDGTAIAWGNNSADQQNIPPELVSIVKLSSGFTHAAAFLNDRSPAVTVQPWNRRVTTGANVTFNAPGVGLPTLNYQWRFNGADIPGATNPTLTLPTVNRGSNGIYTAFISNALGTTLSRGAQLNVGGALKFIAATVGPDGTLSFGAADVSGTPLTQADVAGLEVQASTNLVNWVTLPNALVLTNGTLLLNDSVNNPMRFYRILDH